MASRKPPRKTRVPQKAPQKALDKLPVAHGRAPTRKCFTCQKPKPLASFRPGSNRRTCNTCIKAGEQRIFTIICRADLGGCGASFESASSRAIFCEGCAEPKADRARDQAARRAQRARARRRAEPVEPSPSPTMETRQAK